MTLAVGGTFTQVKMFLFFLLCRDGWRRNRSLSQRGSMTAVDGAVNSGTDAVNSSNQSKPRHVTKGHTSSRSTRERTKERKPRTKTNLNNARQQLPVRRADAVLAHPQDSESAYNTHEASDSYFDPTSSHDHDSNGHGNEKKCDLLNIQQVVKNKLRESQESDLPESQGSNSENESKVKLRDKCLKTGYEPGNKEKRISQSISSDDEDTPVGNGGQVKSYSATVTPAVSGVQVKIDSPVGMTVSQTGESEGCKGTCLKKVEIESKPGESEGCELTCLKKIEIVGRTGKSEGCETTSLNTVETVNQARESEGCKITGLESIASQSLASSEQLKKLQFKSEFEGVSKFEHEHGHSKGCVNEVNQKRGKKGTADTAHSIIKESHVSEGVDVESSFADISVDSSTLKAIENLESTSNESLLSGSTVTHSCISDQNVDSLADDITKKIKGLRNRKHPAVHFIPGSELVREREITPLCSRDSTPTHTQSEIVLPASNAAAKRLRRVTAHSKSESDTETDEEGGSYQQKTLRRRKGRGQDTKESGSGRSSLLPPSTCRKSSTAASSSEGETEAQASECGRRVRLKERSCSDKPYTIKKPCVKRPFSKSPKIGFQYQLLLNACQKYCRMLQGEHSAILSTFIQLPIVVKKFVLSISEWPFYTGFTVFSLVGHNKHQIFKLYQSKIYIPNIKILFKTYLLSISSRENLGFLLAPLFLHFHTGYPFDQVMDKRIAFFLK